MNIYFPGFEPDADIRSELRFINGALDLRQFDKIILSISGGKDSHSLLWLVKNLADRQGAADRLIAVYADTGMEWYNAEVHVRKICAAAGVPLDIVYPVRLLLEQIKHRGQRILEKGYSRRDGKPNSGVQFPSPQCRYCTQNQKIDPMDKHLRQFTGKLLKVTGERWAESKARSNLPEFCHVSRVDSAARTVYGWRPMLAFSEADIWAMVRETGVERHQCYDLGCSRLGCAGCIFSGDNDLRVEMRENPAIFEALDRLEIESGYTMSMSGKRIRERIK